MAGGKENWDRAAVWVSAVLSSCKVNLALKREVLDCQSKAIHPQKYCVCLPPCTGREGSDWALEGTRLQCTSIRKDCAGEEPLKDEGKEGQSVLRDIPAPVPMVQS